MTVTKALVVKLNAAALMENASRLLASAPEILPADVLAAK